jgi:hypothetical protein
MTPARWNPRKANGHEKSFGGLQAMVREFHGRDPLSRHLFLFLSRRRDRVKVLLWKRDGLVIRYKRQTAATCFSILAGTFVTVAHCIHLNLAGKLQSL